jgi:hypothetical protein
LQTSNKIFEKSANPSLLQIQSSLPASSLPELSEPAVMTFTAGFFALKTKKCWAV